MILYIWLLCQINVGEDWPNTHILLYTVEFDPRCGLEPCLEEQGGSTKVAEGLIIQIESLDKWGWKKPRRFTLLEVVIQIIRRNYLKLFLIMMNRFKNWEDSPLNAKSSMRTIFNRMPLYQMLACIGYILLRWRRSRNKCKYCWVKEWADQVLLLATHQSCWCPRKIAHGECAWIIGHWTR